MSSGLAWNVSLFVSLSLSLSRWLQDLDLLHWSLMYLSLPPYFIFRGIINDILCHDTVLP